MLALKALEHEFTGRVKCIFIDPTYNTGVAFEQYEDGLEHSTWLSLMRERLALLSRLLTPDGSLWVTLDDNEAHYMKVLGDEVFGRGCFIGDLSCQTRDGPPNDRKIGSIPDHILIQNTLAQVRRHRRGSLQPMPGTEKADGNIRYSGT